MPQITRSKRRIGFPFNLSGAGVVVLLLLGAVFLRQEKALMVDPSHFLIERLQNPNDPRARIFSHDPIKRNQQHTRPVVALSDFADLPLLAPDDSIYQWGSWDEAPIVVESHKLLFFTIPKCGCTVFKQLFRRMYGYTNWQAHTDTFPHQPIANGLNYLYHYSPSEAQRMLTDPSWTRAIFFRDPNERLLSAYLDKALDQHGKYLRVHCCRGTVDIRRLLQCQTPNIRADNALISFADFLESVVAQCDDPHWRAQARRLPEKYWPYINFVGNMNRLEMDTKDLLQQIGAWEDFGAEGWESGAIFVGSTSVAHATHAKRKVVEYYTPSLAKTAEDLHREDYEHPILRNSFSRSKRRGFVMDLVPEVSI
jgi:hypothetical protein